MMDGKVFVLIIIGLSMAAWIVNNMIRARHGYPLEDEWGGKSTRLPGSDDAEATRQITLLSNENADLKGKLLRIEERVAVLERIATDKGTRLADEIERLR